MAVFPEGIEPSDVLPFSAGLGIKKYRFKKRYAAIVSDGPQSKRIILEFQFNNVTQAQMITMIIFLQGLNGDYVEHALPGEPDKLRRFTPESEVISGTWEGYDNGSFSVLMGEEFPNG